MKMNKIAYALAVIGLSGVTLSAVAAEEKIQITGSSIKRIAKEGALPVQTFTKEDIAKTGVTSVADLVAQLPAMQGFSVAADSVGGGGGGQATASLHDLGSEYTLVLLNGRRMAPAGSGSVVDLNTIPLSAIERVEVLTDGASALYGSDAIAGVINFILKKNQKDIQLDARYTSPQHAGGKGWNASISGGFGDLQTQGFNVLLAYSHDQQDQLRSKDRSFAKSGIVPVDWNGQKLYFFNGSANAIPGNAFVDYYDKTGTLASASFNPYQRANGACAPDNVLVGDTCSFDYTSTIEIFPESVRDSIFGKGELKIGENFKAFAEVAASKFKMTTRIAPYPTGAFKLPTSGALFDTHIKPFLPADFGSFANPAGGDSEAGLFATWRVLPGGNRTSNWVTESRHLVGGMEAELGKWDLSASLTQSVNEASEERPTGYVIANSFLDSMQAGKINPFVTGDKLTATERAELAKSIYSGPYTKDKTTLNAFNFRSSNADLFTLPGGSAAVGAGLDYRQHIYTSVPSAAARTLDKDGKASSILLFEDAAPVWDFERKAFGIYGELLMPVLKELELTTSVRYDEIGEVTDNLLKKSLNKAQQDTTYKVGLRYQPSRNTLIRASYGTGFKMPTILEIGRPRTDFGVTSDTYSCPTVLTGELLAACKNSLRGGESSQMNVFVQGNPNLKPEKSKQWTVGFRVEPSKNLSVGLDLWQVEMTDAVNSLDEAEAFTNAARYLALGYFVTKKNAASGKDELAVVLPSFNIGGSLNRGLDWDMMLKNTLPFGKLTTNFSGTYLLKSNYTQPGTETWTTSLGQFGSDLKVSFRVISRLAFALQHGDFTHAMNVKYRSGYDDQAKAKGTLRVGSPTGPKYRDEVVKLEVPSYTTIDWQSSLTLNKALNIKLGVNNLFDKKPHLSLRSGGSGHQIGYDPRYSDPIGRTYYLSAGYKF